MRVIRRKSTALKEKRDADLTSRFKKDEIEDSVSPARL